MPFPVSGVKKWTGGRTHLLPATITTQRTGHHDQEDEASRPTKRAAAMGDERPIHYLRAGAVVDPRKHLLVAGLLPGRKSVPSPVTRCRGGSSGHPTPCPLLRP